MRNKKIFAFIFFSAFFLNGFAIEFYFDYKENTGYTISSVVREHVYFNGVFSHNAEINNHAFVKIQKVHPDKSADFTATYTASDKSTLVTGNFVSWGKEYKSSFNVSRLGKYTISDEFYMPSVRDVPVFPEGNVEKDDIWERASSEAHDLGRQFGMTKPIIIPARTLYQYMGEMPRPLGDEVLHVINVHHKVGGPIPHPPNTTEEVPIRMEGTSNMTLMWDNERHRLDHYNENFEISLYTNKGNVMTFKGYAHSSLTESSLGEEEVNQIREKIEELDLDGVEVEKSDKGISLSIDSIQFEANSDKFLDGQDEKLEKIATILREFKYNNLLISGHTALAGTEETRAVLSLKRARAVARYLKEKGVKQDKEMFVEGLGAERPVADNDTEEGMAKNRRVEITILD